MPLSSQPLWTDRSIKSGICVRELISALKQKTQAGNEWSNILSESSQAREKPPPVISPSITCETTAGNEIDSSQG